MICPDCLFIDDNLPNCARCEGTGRVCDECGAAAADGISDLCFLCDSNQPDCPTPDP